MYHGDVNRQRALENPSYDKWKLASPPDWDLDDRLVEAIEDAETAASYLASRIPEISDDCPGGLDDDGNVYVDITLSFRVLVPDASGIREHFGSALDDLGERLLERHEATSDEK